MKTRMKYLDSEGFIYVVDPVNECIRKYNSKGKWILKWGEKEDVLKGYDLTVDSKGYVHVSDLVNKRIQVFKKK